MAFETKFQIALMVLDEACKNTSRTCAFLPERRDLFSIGSCSSNWIEGIAFDSEKIIESYSLPFN